MKVDTPSNLTELRTILADAGPAHRLIAGGTDLLVRLHSSPALSVHLVDLSGIPELKNIVLRENTLEIGACATFSQIEESSLVSEFAPALARAASLVGSPQIRNLGTLGGNIGNASPAADSLPPLCAFSASVLIEDAHGGTEIVAPGDIATAPGKTLLRKDQYIRHVSIPIRHNSFSFFAKIGSRKAVAISKLSVAAYLSPGLEEVRLFAGSLGVRPVRLIEAEKILVSEKWHGEDEKSFLDALSSAVESAIPGRSSLTYKRTAVRGLGDGLWRTAKKVFSRG